MLNELLKKEKELFLQTYKRLPLDISHGEGVHIIDKSGKKYLDFTAGLAVNALGYAHPEIITAVMLQISRFSHLSNFYITDVQIEFAETLLAYSRMSKVFLTNSGTEAVEAALKIIRKKYGPAGKIYSLTGSFHGRTTGALTLTGNEKYKKNFNPLMPNIFKLNFNDVEDLKAKVNKDCSAVFIEFIQGEGGVKAISQEFASTLVSLKEKFGFSIISDEIQSGIGRTGKPFYHDYYNINPDIILTAKSIGGGLPLGAVLVTDEFKDIFQPGDHGSTFGGNPVSCAAGKVVLTEVFENGLMDNAHELGIYLTQELNLLQKSFPRVIKEVRGKGLMIGVELFNPGDSVVDKMRERNVLINCTAGNVLRFLPPLIITKDDIDFVLYNFREILKEENGS